MKMSNLDELREKLKPFVYGERDLEKVLKLFSQYLEQAELKARIDAVNKFGNGSWYREPDENQRYFHQTIAELQAQLITNQSKEVEESPHVHDSFCLNYGKCSE